jgi:hypothetical protein
MNITKRILGRYSVSKEYNQVYEKLVKNQNDYTGMIAYCIYKDEKRKWIQKGESADQFVKLKLESYELRKYKTQADILLTKAYQANADEEIESIKLSLSKAIIESAKASLSKGITSHWLPWHKNVATGILGNFWTGVIAVSFVWILSSPETWKSAVDSAFLTAKQWLG